tara:strand:- start:107 stop:1126 length:1020 start_codon:yes stop_codon:yes gene_type:complete
MEILIDEAGSFVVKGAKSNSWCVVTAYASPETEKKKCQEILIGLKRKEETQSPEEIKLHEVQEDNYLWFLKNLADCKGILLCTATDSDLNLEPLVKNHQLNQAVLMKNNIDRIRHENGKGEVRCLASQLENLPTQLYVQLVCQIQLMLSFVIKGISYFVQRNPNTLESFRWRIDQKEPNKKTDFEDTFEKFSPALLQTISISEPAPLLDWCDYSPMQEFICKNGEIPDYLKENFSHLIDDGCLNIEKIIRKDIKFIDSKASTGVQIVDLLASGVRRLLKRDFKRNEDAARLLGSLMVQGEYNDSPIKFITFGGKTALEKEVSKLVKIMIRSCRPMVKKS